MFDAVIFDWDGTLADTKFAVVTSFQKVLRQIGCKVSDEFLERWIGIGTKNVFIRALKATNIPFTDETINELVNKKDEVQSELTKTVNLFEGALDLLNSLHTRIKMALASMSSRKIIDKLLYEKCVQKYFDVVITADEISYPKPNPDIFLRCATKLGCTSEKCIVVEDSIFGVKAAKEAKMMCIAIPSGAYSREELEGEHPDVMVDSMKEKEKILNFILT